MPEKLSEEQVRHVAKLCRLTVSDAEVEHFREQLAAILEYIDKLSALDVDGVEPMAHALDVTNALRPDEPSAGMAIVDVLANAPQKSSPFFQVPKVLGEGGNA